MTHLHFTSLLENRTSYNALGVCFLFTLVSLLLLRRYEKGRREGLSLQGREATAINHHLPLPTLLVWQGCC